MVPTVTFRTVFYAISSRNPSKTSTLTSIPPTWWLPEPALQSDLEFSGGLDPETARELGSCCRQLVRSRRKLALTDPWLWS